MKISIITASYNYENFIEQAINSVINQSYTNWELIIVDDGSSDNSVKIIQEFCKKDERIKLFQHENSSNKGLKETLLLGLKKASGDFVAFLESDDSFAPDNLEKKVKIAKKYPNAGLIFNKVNFMWEDENRKNINGKLFENNQKKLSQMNFPKNMFKDFFIDNQIFTFSCVMLRPEILEKDFFNTPLDKCLDWWLWIHLAYNNDFYYIDEPLTNWRLHFQSYITEGKNLNRWFMLPIAAYEDVYKKRKDFKILMLILHQRLKIYFIRGARFFKKLFK